MPVRNFRFLSVVIGIADRLASPPGLGVSPQGEPVPFSPGGRGSSRRRRFDAAHRNRRLSPAMQFGRPRNALGQGRTARQQAAFPGLR